MINRREDYKFVSVPNELSVDGSVLPVRVSRNDGSWKHLKGEDPAFLQEAMFERLFCCSNGSTTLLYTEDYPSGMNYAWSGIKQDFYTEPPDRHIVGQRIKDTVNALHAMRRVYARQIPQTPQHGAWYVENRSSSLTLPEILGVSIQQNALKSDPSDFDTGSPLSKDSLQNVFDDLQTLRYPTTIGSYAGGHGVTITGTRWEPKGNQYWNTPGGTTVQDNWVQYNNGGQLKQNCGCYLLEGTYEISIPAEGGRTVDKGNVTDDFTVSAQAYADFDYTVQQVNFPNMGETIRHFWNIVVPVNSTKQGSKLVVTASDIRTAAYTAHMAVGDLWFEPSMLGRSQDGSQIITLERLGAIWTLGSHTKWWS